MREIENKQYEKRTYVMKYLKIKFIVRFVLISLLNCFFFFQRIGDYLYMV